MCVPLRLFSCMAEEMHRGDFRVFRRVYGHYLHEIGFTLLEKLSWAIQVQKQIQTHLLYVLRFPSSSGMGFGMYRCDFWGGRNFLLWGAATCCNYKKYKKLWDENTKQKYWEIHTSKNRVRNTWAEGWEREEAMVAQVGARLVVGNAGAGWSSGGWKWWGSWLWW